MAVAVRFVAARCTDVTVAAPLTPPNQAEAGISDAEGNQQPGRDIAAGAVDPRNLLDRHSECDADVADHDRRPHMADATNRRHHERAAKRLVC